MRSLFGMVLVFTAIVVVVVGRSSFTASALAAEKARPVEVSVDEIDKSLVLIGRLRKPLGTLMTVRGKWSYPEEPAKDSSLRFTVSHLDGKELGKPVEFNVRQLDVVTKKGSKAIPSYDGHPRLAGKEWTLRAYETGSIEMIPEEYFKETPPHAVPYYFDTFTSKLTGVLQP